MRKRPKKVVVYKKYGHFFMVYEIFSVKKLTCNAVSLDPEDDHEYIRIIANTAPRPIPSCQNGPGASCRFDKFVELVGRGWEYGDFDGVCGNDKEEDGVEGKEEL
jgi:hypothetical protein